jgi:hypothetical protein
LYGKPTLVPALIKSEPGVSFKKFNIGNPPPACLGPSTPVELTLIKSASVTVTPPFHVLLDVIQFK